MPLLSVVVPVYLNAPQLQELARVHRRLAELPAGIDWFLQTPVLVRLADGVVECAAEVEATAPECLDW